MNSTATNFLEMVKMIVIIIIACIGTASFSQNLTNLVSKDFYEKVANEAYTTVLECNPDTTYDFIHIHFMGQPHEYVKLLNLYCDGITVRIRPRLEHSEYENIISIFIETNKLGLLSSFFDAQYKINDFDNYTDIYRKQVRGKKARLISKRAIINMKKKKGLYRIVDIRLMLPNK